jgi:hypothetical protein
MTSRLNVGDAAGIMVDSNGGTQLIGVVGTPEAPAMALHVDMNG